MGVGGGVMLSGAGREIDGDHGEFGGLTTDQGLTTDHQSDGEVSPMLAYVGRSKSSKKKDRMASASTTTGTVGARPTSKKSLDDLHQTAAMLIRETRGAGLKVEVEKPRSLALFLQELNVAKTERAAPSNGAKRNIEAKSWSRLLDKEHLARLAKQRPRPSSGSDFTSSDLQVNLTILSTGVPGSSQREVEQRRTRQQIAPRAKKASIDLLNDRLDTRIAMQKKAQALRMRLDRGVDLCDDGDEPKYETFKEGARMEEDLREEVDADGSSTSEEEEEEGGAQAVEDGPGVMEALGWRARGTTYELGRTRRPVIEDSDEETPDSLIAGPHVSEDDEVLGALISTSDLEGDGGEGVTGGALKEELRQTDLSRFLSGAFSPKPNAGEKTKESASDGPPRSASHKKPRDEKEKKVRSAFFEEEAEDDDDDDGHGYEEEGMDEEAMEAELAQSKFIDQSADEEEDGLHHLDVHRAIMKADDDRALDQVLLKFARDKTLHGPASLAHLHSKYNQPTTDQDDDEERVGENAGSLGLPLRDMTERMDAALFKLIEEEQSDGDDFDLDDDDQSLSEDGLFPDEQQDDQDDEGEHDEDPAYEEHEVERLEDSLASLFSHPSTTMPGIPSNTLIGGKRAMATLDAERRARLLAAQDEDEQVERGGGGAFKKIKK